MLSEKRSFPRANEPLKICAGRWGKGSAKKSPQDLDAGAFPALSGSDSNYNNKNLKSVIIT